MQAEVRPIVVVVGDVGADQADQLQLMEHDNVIEQLATTRSFASSIAETFRSRSLAAGTR